jgi:hypothetical protein
MKRIIAEQVARRKQEVTFRTDRLKAAFGQPQLGSGPIKIELAEKTRAIAHGGMALVRQIVAASGLVDAINQVSVLKLKLPYWESDHVLNLACNLLCGGRAIEHIEYRRNDPTYLDMLGTHSIPDPTTAGDFCRRYSATQIDQLQDRINDARINVWARQPKSFFDEAEVDMDGTITPTDGECKQGMDISYKGEWGYHPLIVSLANTKEILFVQNRSGNRPSHEGAHAYVDKCIILLREAGFKKIRFRGDGDFSQTKHLDRWDDEGVLFVFGLDAMPNLVDIAESMENTDWKRLERPPKYDVKTKERKRPENVKERIVEAREFLNKILIHEDYAAFDYRPVACDRDYRVVSLRKTITVKKGQQLLIPEIRYFFYITHDRDKSVPEIIFEANKRCDQENLIGQLKSGMNALSMPLDTLNANWLYTVAACLAWTLKSWLALWLVNDGRNREDVRRKDRLLKMEFATFLQAMITIPAQILRSGRQTVVRLLNINDWTATFFRLADQLRPAKKVLRE